MLVRLSPNAPICEQTIERRDGKYALIVCVPFEEIRIARDVDRAAHGV
jgi:hypothetical protein